MMLRSKSLSFPPHRGGSGEHPLAWQRSKSQGSRLSDHSCSRMSATILKPELEKLLNTCFNPEQLEQLVCHSLPALTGDRRGLQFQGLAQQCCHSTANHHLLPYTNQLVQVADWLCSILDNSTSLDNTRLPAKTLAHIHANMGWIQESGRQYQQATRSYLLAVWIWSHQTTSGCGQHQHQQHNKDLLAAALYRLGACYGRIGQDALQKATLQRAFQAASCFESSPPPTDDKFLWFRRSAPRKQPPPAPRDDSASTCSTSFMSSRALGTVLEEEDVRDDESATLLADIEYIFGPTHGVRRN